MAQNRPLQQPPRDVSLAPETYLPSAGRALVTAVTTARESPDPRASGRVGSFASEALAVPPPVVDRATAVAEAVVNMRYPASAFVADQDDRRLLALSETCQYSPEEQHQLLELRRRLASCASELSRLRSHIVREDGAGLPRLREAHRCRLGGNTFSVEDAKRELCQPWLEEKMAAYIVFIDSALADTLDTSPRAASRRSVPPSPSPALTEEGTSSERGLERRSPPLKLVPSPTPRIGSLGE
mmetsp:Transcript_47971/g.104367  ORF Transcript_47971/g.104367 Transcript_47971/m.104367 type:complete len:241 (+) Transcript_47971:50-772(+)